MYFPPHPTPVRQFHHSQVKRRGEGTQEGVGRRSFVPSDVRMCFSVQKKGNKKTNWSNSNRKSGQHIQLIEPNPTHILTIRYRLNQVVLSTGSMDIITKASTFNKGHCANALDYTIGNQAMSKQSNRFEFHLKYLCKFLNYIFPRLTTKEHHNSRGLT